MDKREKLLRAARTMCDHRIQDLARQKRKAKDEIKVAAKLAEHHRKIMMLKADKGRRDEMREHQEHYEFWRGRAQFSAIEQRSRKQQIGETIELRRELEAWLQKQTS